MSNLITLQNKIYISQLLLWLPFLLFGAEADKLVQYTTKHGLANNYIHGITQDKAGFMWFITKNGISRFDGHNFINYYSKPHSDNTLSDNEVYDIEIDQSGIIWLATASGGLNRFDIHIGSLAPQTCS